MTFPTNYSEAIEFLNGKSSRKVAKIRDTYVFMPFSGRIDVRYHGTSVVSFHGNGQTTLRSGGFYTVTTKRRLNQFSSAHVYQRKGIWYVDSADGTRVFEDGIVLNLLPHNYRQVGSLLESA